MTMARAFEFSYPTVQMDSVGTYVEIAQHLIYVRGEKLPRYGIDGEFGLETQGAIMRIQNRAGLPADGVVDIKTWAYLLTGEVNIIESDDSGEDTAAQTGV